MGFTPNTTNKPSATNLHWQQHDPRPLRVLCQFFLFDILLLLNFILLDSKKSQYFVIWQRWRCVNGKLQLILSIAHSFTVESNSLGVFYLCSVTHWERVYCWSSYCYFYSVTAPLPIASNGFQKLVVSTASPSFTQRFGRDFQHTLNGKQM